MASNQSTGESKPDDQQIFKTKLIDYDGFQVRIVAQDTNGPCPLIAVCNVLLLKQKFHLVSLTVSADTLLEHVADQLCQGAASLAGDRNQDLTQALEALPRFKTGIDVNFRFDKIDGFVDMPELAIFRLLKIPLYHGWMVDPQDSDTAKAFGSKPYNRIIKEVADFRARNAGGEEKNVLLEDGGFHQKRKGDLEEQEALTEALAESLLSPNESIVPGTTISHASAHSVDHGLVNNTGSGIQQELSLSQDSSALSSFYPGMLSLGGSQEAQHICMQDESGCSLHLDKADHHSACDTTAILGPSATTSVNSSMDVRGPVDERELVVAKHVERGCENDSDMDLSPFIIRAKGLPIDAFLENNKNQLTIYGLFALQEGLADGELCVFFCSNHFNTMTKYKNELYVLVIDQGYVSQPDLVWGKLNEVNGDTVFVTGDFKIFRQEAWIKDSWDEQKALTGTNNYLTSSESSVLSNDEKLLAEFQRKKFKGELQHQPTSKPASRVATGLQALFLVLPTESVATSKLLSKLEREGDQKTVQRMIDKMAWEGCMEAKGSHGLDPEGGSEYGVLVPQTPQTLVKLDVDDNKQEQVSTFIMKLFECTPFFICKWCKSYLCDSQQMHLLNAAHPIYTLYPGESLHLCVDPSIGESICDVNGLAFIVFFEGWCWREKSLLCRKCQRKLGKKLAPLVFKDPLQPLLGFIGCLQGEVGLVLIMASEVEMSSGSLEEQG